MVGESVALLVIVILPVAAPAAVGVNVALNDVLCPAARVKGNESPLRLKPAPAILACVIVTSAVPLLLRETVLLLLLPTTTSPNAMLAGLAASWRVTDFPARDIVAGAPGKSPPIEMSPVKLPGAVGANVTVKLALAPAARASGNEMPLIAKAFPVTLA
jgi:hypothetical protein